MPQCNDPRCGCNAPRRPTAEDKIRDIERLVANQEEPGPWPDDIYGMCGGNYDDAFMQGANHGEAVLARDIRKILDA